MYASRTRKEEFLGHHKNWRHSEEGILSVTFVRPTQAIEIFGNVSTPFGTLAICDLSVKILRRSFQGNPSVGRLNRRGVAKYSDFGPLQGYIYMLSTVLISFVLAMLKWCIPALAIQFSYSVYLVLIGFTISSCGLINWINKKINIEKAPRIDDLYANVSPAVPENQHEDPGTVIYSELQRRDWRTCSGAIWWFLLCLSEDGEAVTFFQALHGMQTRSGDENSLCLSARLSVNAWYVTKRKKDLSRFLYHTKDHFHLLRRRMIGGGRPLACWRILTSAHCFEI